MPQENARSPWHDGELRLQRRAGVAERMAETGRRVMRDYLTDQHRAFYPLLPFVVIGAVDAAGDAWATLRAGRPGFMASPDPRHLAVALPREPSDPAESGMADGAAVALLGIELSTRRRNRLNGAIRRHGADGFTVTAAQAFGNCPRYIERRDFTFVRDPDAPANTPPVQLPHLDHEARAMIYQADTFFVASYVDGPDGRRQVDVSHRGGRPGFVHMDGVRMNGVHMDGRRTEGGRQRNGSGKTDDVLTIPDYAGNLYFNTLGNIALNPHAGLAFVDFDSGDLLQMTGDAELLIDSADVSAFDGAERLWRFRPRRIIRRARALPLRWTRMDAQAP